MKNNKKMHKLKIAYIISILIFFLCISFFVFQIVAGETELNKTFTEAGISRNTDSESSDTKNDLSAYFDKFKNYNSDVVAVLKADEYITPIVQTTNNRDYLKQGLNKKYAYYGTPFLDYENNSDFSDFNNIIFGHNMGTNKCFGFIKNLYNKKPNTPLYIQTENNIYKASYLTTINSSDISNEDYKVLLTKGFNSNSKNKYINTILKYVPKKTNIDVNNDKIITLYTCAYNSKNARYLIIFKVG